MRELKFRQPLLNRDGSFNKFHYWGILDDGFTGREMSGCEKGDDQQFTGLLDKNSKEIYEGDWLGGIWGDGYIGYCDKCKSLEYIAKEFGCMACSGDVHWFEIVDDDGKLEVIGNIHEKEDKA